MKLRVFLDGEELYLADGQLKVVVEGLGPEGDEQLHYTFEEGGVVRDVFVDNRLESRGTDWDTYEDVVADLNPRG